MVHAKQSISSGSVGNIPTSKSRLPVQAFSLQNRLQFGQKFILQTVKSYAGMVPPHCRHVCLSLKQTSQQVCQQTSPLAIMGSRCIENASRQCGTGVCQPTLANNWAIASQIEGQSSYRMSNNTPLVGFHKLVAPSSTHARATLSHNNGGAMCRSIQRLPEQVYAKAKMAPPLHYAVRKMLEEKGAKDHPHYSTPPIKFKRYDSAWKLFYGYMLYKGKDPLQATTAQVASSLANFFQYSPHQARNAYSA